MKLLVNNAVRALLTLTLTAVSASLHAQDSLTLDQCYRLLERNHPLVQQKPLLARSAGLTQESIRKNFLPQMGLSAQATWQSDVPHVPVSPPGSDIPMPNKDQYRATVDVTQLLYDGGSVRNSLDADKLNTEAAQQQVGVSVYQVRSRVNHSYFTVLFLQEKNKLLALAEQNLVAQWHEVRSAIRNGTAIPSAADALQAGILQTRQQLFENRADREAALQTLGDLIGVRLDTNASLKRPDLEANFGAPPSRPELRLYAIRQEHIEAASRVIGNANTPKVSLFAQGGYGNPGLNVLDNTFQPFFMGGIRLSWKILDWNILQDQQQALLLQKDLIDAERQTFNLNTTVELRRQRAEIEKLVQLLRTDEEIIALRTNVARAARAQLRNGTLTASEYLIEENALNESLISRSAHEVRLLQAHADYMITQGIPEP